MDAGTLFYLFLLSLVRVSAFLMVSPIFALRGIPTAAKIGLALILAGMVTAGVPALAEGTEIAFDGAYLLLVLKEALVGLILGFAASMIFLAIQTAGGIIDFQIGFGLTNLIDPNSGNTMPLTANFKNILAMLFFLSVDGHHQLIAGLMSSYEVIPWHHLPSWGEGGIAQNLVRLFAYSMAIALQIAAPMVAVLFLVDLAIGIIARTVPQMNFFVIGFPFKIMISILLLFLLLPGFFYILTGVFSRMFAAMSELMGLLGI